SEELQVVGHGLAPVGRVPQARSHSNVVCGARAQGPADRQRHCLCPGVIARLAAHGLPVAALDGHAALHGALFEVRIEEDLDLIPGNRDLHDLGTRSEGGTWPLTDSVDQQLPTAALEGERLLDRAL